MYYNKGCNWQDRKKDLSRACVKTLRSGSRRQRNCSRPSRTPVAHASVPSRSPLRPERSEKRTLGIRVAVHDTGYSPVPTSEYIRRQYCIYFYSTVMYVGRGARGRAHDAAAEWAQRPRSQSIMYMYHISIKKQTKYIECYRTMVSSL